MRCKLCLQEATLRNSHIVPEFLYKKIYDEKGRMMVISDRGPPWQQKGRRERLLCDHCEQLLNERYEKPFHAWWKEAVPRQLPQDARQVRFKTHDYVGFRLFHLSVLWRASVALHRDWNKVWLGPHEERIRKLLLDFDPGPPGQYQLVAEIMLLPGGVVNHKMVSSPIRYRQDGRYIYEMIYAGCIWWTNVSYRYPALAPVELKTDGSMIAEVTDALDYTPALRMAAKFRLRKLKGLRDHSG